MLNREGGRKGVYYIEIEMIFLSKVSCFYPAVYISSFINSNRLYTTLL